MFDEWHMWNQWNQWQEFAAGQEAVAALGRKGLRRERRVVRDQMNPFTTMSDKEFVEQFQLKKESVNDIILKITDHLPYSTDRRGCRVPPHLQVLMALATMASGSHQAVIADSFHVSQAIVSQCVARVASAIAGLSKEYIKGPTGNSLHKVREDFHAIAGMPGVVGCIDCTHIQIVRPPRDDSELFRCREGYFSLNIQGVCGPDLLFHNIVVGWPGSISDETIFKRSQIYAALNDDHLTGHLLGDNDYTNSRYLFTPLWSPNSSKEVRYNASHIKTRNTIERAFGVLKRRFAYLSRIIKTNLLTTKAIIISSAVLHNIAIKTRIDMEEDKIDIHDNLQNIDINAIDNIMQANSDDNEQPLGNLERKQVIQDYF